MHNFHTISTRTRSSPPARYATLVANTTWSWTLLCFSLVNSEGLKLFDKLEIYTLGNGGGYRREMICLCLAGFWRWLIEWCDYCSLNPTPTYSNSFHQGVHWSGGITGTWTPETIWKKVTHIINPIPPGRGGGGGMWCPRQLWIARIFRQLKIIPPYDRTFPQTYLAFWWCGRTLVMGSDVAMATAFWRACLAEF